MKPLEPRKPLNLVSVVQDKYDRIYSVDYYLATAIHQVLQPPEELRRLIRNQVITDLAIWPWRKLLKP
jgi:hypothetical protein